MQIIFGYEEDFFKIMKNLKIKYGEHLFDLEEIGRNLDIEEFTQSFLKNNISDSSIDTNANVRSKHIGTYFVNLPKPYTRLHSIYIIWKKLSEMFDKKVANNFVELQINGALYVHDLHHSGYMPYCYAYSLEKIVREGLQFIDTIKSAPAKHLSTFIQHVIQFVMFASNQSSGAVGLPDLFVWMWYFIKKDIECGVIPENKIDWYIEQHFQIIVYSLNQPIRTNQAPYTNFTYLDRNYINSIFKGVKYPDGTSIVDHVEDIIDLQKKFWEWVSRERERQMFTFPVMTASLLYKDGKFLDEDSAKFINKVNMKWQDTNWYISDSIDAVASCCRLTSSTKCVEGLKLNLESNSSNGYELKGMMNSIGGSDLNIGSFKVVTINLPRIALESQRNISKFFDILNKRIKLVQKILAAIREIIKDRISQELLPLYSKGLMDLNRQYGTIGIIGVWEAASLMDLTFESFEGVKYSEEGERFVSKILDTLKTNVDEGKRRYGFTFNIEQVPGEKAAVTLAKKDKYIFDLNDYFEIYSNQWLPLTANANVLDRIRLAGIFDRKVSGGAILHVNLDSQFRDEEESWRMINLIAKMGVIYFAFNTRISVCSNGHAFYGEICPICGGKKFDEFTRIVGYLVPVSGFNKERRITEYPRRKFYSISI
ncbi:MAG: anaerobic ribonucleoside-triphosphate reductase [Thermotogae bacterium]|nr:anaerobic ribonucleoside-triphosphate reductase [Thermotogota bacterium]